MNVLLIRILCSIFAIGLMYVFFVIRSRNIKKSIQFKIISDAVKSFDSYVSVLEFHMHKAFDIIYKDRILVFSIDGLSPNEGELDVIAKDFSRLVLKLLGPALIEQFILLYGNEETFLFNIVEYFNTRYENDEIKQGALDNLSNSEEDEKK